ncbi:hypothetical protein MKX03_006743, partial [Papaver bracteatum]
GKTDYGARIHLINQDKNKYNTPKYRFVIISATITGDLVICAAYAHEFPQYGIEVGLTNYAAAYCTGLLLARRVLKKLEMDAEYEGNVEVYTLPFCALLDVGLLRTTTGNRIFVPCGYTLELWMVVLTFLSDKRFAGFKKGEGKKDAALDPEIHRKYIFGGHVCTYMRSLMEDEPENFQTHFSKYAKRNTDADGLESLYKKVHAATSLFGSNRCRHCSTKQNSLHAVEGV